MKKMLDMAIAFVKGAGEKDLGVYAAGSAFFWILSAAPIAVVLKEAAKGTLSLALLVALWSAGRGMLSMIRGFNCIYGIQEQRGYIRLRIIASIYMVLMLFSIFFMLAILVFGRSIYEQFLSSIPIVREISELVIKIRFGASVLILGVIFSLLYIFLPDRSRHIKQDVCCGFLAALGCTGFSFFFSLYIEFFGGYSSYGSLRILVIVMLWLYFMIYIVLYGAYLNHFLVEHHYR